MSPWSLVGEPRRALQQTWRGGSPPSLSQVASLLFWELLFFKCSAQMTPTAHHTSPYPNRLKSINSPSQENRTLTSAQVQGGQPGFGQAMGRTW